MSFLWGKSKTEDHSRSKHISDLQSCFPSLRRPNNDDSSFELVFEANHQVNTLRIWLPSDFPANKPVLQVIGTISHPWLDQYKRVSGCDKLMYWDKKTSSLREVVEVVLSELRRALAASQHQQQLPGQYANPPRPQQNMHQHMQRPTYPAANQPSNQQQMQAQSMQYGNMRQRSGSSQYPANTAGGADMTSTTRHSYSSAQPHGGFYEPMQTNASQNYRQGFIQGQRHAPQSQPQSDLSKATVHQQMQQQQPQQHLSQQQPSSQQSTQPKADNVTERRPVSVERFQISLPLMPTEFPELKTLEVAQLERLLKDEIALQSHVSGMDCVGTLRTMRDDLRKSNAEDAQRCVNMTEENRDEEEEILILQNNLRAAINSYKTKLAEYSGKYAAGKEETLLKLRARMTTLDDRSEDMAQSFLGGDLEMDEFLQGFVKARTNYHELKLSMKKVQ